MKYIRYSRYTGEPADEVDLQELIKRLGDFFLQSGFESQYYGVSEFDPEQTMEMLRQAILRALAEGDLLPEDLMEELTKARFGQERGAIAGVGGPADRAADAGGIHQRSNAAASDAAS